MFRSHRISIVMPCHNEADGLSVLLPGLPDWIDEVIVVDNNSSDNSSFVAGRAGAKVIEEPVQGYGAAYRAGFEVNTGEIVVTMDADATYPITAIGPMIDLLIDDDLDFVSGTRLPLPEPANMPWLNRVGNKVLTGVTRLLFGLEIKDSQSGMWVFRASILPTLRLESNGMPLSQEIKIKTIRSGFKFTEYPIAYADRVGDVKLRRWQDGFANLTHLFLLRFGRR